MPKVSVIIPVYNVENYIEKCARSLFEQTLQDIEYIFVDDASPDNSMSVLESVIKDYPERMTQITIIHHETNRGLPIARHTGLLKATGDYIAHCDSDDWVDLSLYEMMSDYADSHNCDLVVCNMRIIYDNSYLIRHGLLHQDVDAFINDLFYQRVPLNVINKMYRRSVYHNEIVYPTYNMGEDMALTFQLILYCKTIGLIQNVCYNYNATSLSITRSQTKASVYKKAWQSCENAKLIENYYKSHQVKRFDKGLIRLKYMQKKHYMPIINYQECYSEWRRTFPEITKCVLFDSSLNISLKDRLFFLLTLVGVFPIIKQYTRHNLD